MRRTISSQRRSRRLLDPRFREDGNQLDEGALPVSDLGVAAQPPELSAVTRAGVIVSADGSMRVR
jgi:hypothetical protein